MVMFGTSSTIGRPARSTFDNPLGEGAIPTAGRPAGRYGDPSPSSASRGTGFGVGRTSAYRTLSEGGSNALRAASGGSNWREGIQPSLSDWQNTYNAYLNQARSESMGEWAANQSRLASLMDEANQRRIAADFAGLGAGINQRLMNQLGQLARQEGRASIDALNQQDVIARRLADLMAGGYRADSRYIDKQADSIRDQLLLDRRRTNEARREGRNIFETNTRNIGGAAGAAGAFFSSATDDLMSDEDRNLQLLLDRANTADAQSKKEYDAARNALMREREKIKQNMSQNDINLMNQLAQNQRGRESIFNNAVQEELRRRAEAERAALEARQAQEQANAFYRGIQQQQALAWYTELERQRLANFFAGFAAGPPPTQTTAQRFEQLQRNIPSGSFSK